MRYVRIFSIYFQDAFQYRSTSFVWFILALLNPLVVLLFWRGAFLSGGSPLEGWTYEAIASYYLLLVIANTLLLCHVENDIARRDIQMGMLSSYLMKPFSYLIHKFFSELPWRVIQGFFALIAILFFIFVLKMNIHISSNMSILLLSILITVIAHLVGFLFKMILGLSAFWVTDYSGLQQLVEVSLIIFAGFVMPIALFPDVLRTVAFVSPFAYMIYFPVVAFLGQLSFPQLFQVIGGELFWLAAFYCIYRILWEKGIKKFSSIGQ